MDIPDEAPVRVYIDPYNGAAYISKTPNSTELRFGKEAWAAFEAGVARSAQVAVLRELECRFVRISENWTLLGDLARASVYGVEGSYLRGKLDELEAGAGQAEVRDGRP